MVQTCIVNGCKKEAYPGCRLSFHRFPSNQVFKKRWTEVLNISGKLCKYAVVCSSHFKAEDYITEARKQLKPEAVPSLLPKIIPKEKKITVLSSILVETPKTLSTSGFSVEPPLKKIKLQAEISTQTQEFSLPRKAKLRREVKILKQKLKRRDMKIKNMQDILNIIKKCLSNKYLTVRMTTYGKNKTVNLLGNRARLRQKLHKTILFSNI